MFYEILFRSFGLEYGIWERPTALLKHTSLCMTLGSARSVF